MAAYARVSTNSEEQLTSYEAQVDYYTKYIKERTDWEFVKIYTDEGISATNARKRDGFKEMIEDALAGKIDLIITKSVSRFARNTVDSLTAIRQLKEKGVEVYFEKENIYTLDAKGEMLLRQCVLPKNLVIIGGGYTGVEFASTYADFGSKVTVIQNGSLFLPREDREIADAVYENLKSRGIEILANTEIQSIEEKEGKAVVKITRENERRSLEADTVLVATGRKPNTEGLELEKAGVKLTSRDGIVTDAHLRTTVPNIYAMGDVVGGLQFTYISLDDFRIVRSAVLGDGSYTTEDRGVVPYSVFVNPPFSRVGLSEEDAIQKGYSVKIMQLPASAIPRSLVVEQSAGLLKAVIDGKTGLILGAHLFCEESHEMINAIKLAIDAKLPYTVLRDMIFTHPTMSEAFNDLFNA